MKKRILSLCMVAALLFGMLPNIALSVRAETIASGTSEEGFRWELDSEGTLTISGEGPMEDHSPAGSGYGSWVDANVGFHDIKIQKVIISEGITKIGNSAFASCLYLKSVEIPDTVTEIGGWAFLTCEELQEIEIPFSVGLIGNMAFQACEKLEQIVLPEGIPSIGDQTFAYCTNLQSIVIPSSVTSIGMWAFANCDQLRQIYFSGNAPSFGDGTYDYVFDGVIATAYYPANNSTWTTDIMQDHGGFITWEPMDSLGNTNPTEESPSLFISVVESRIVECKFDSLSAEEQQECRGILVDLDSDGNDELILRYLDRWDDLIFEVWKIQNGTPSCINTVNLFSGGIETNGSLSSAAHEGKQYLVYQWINSGMDYVNDLSEVYCLVDGKYEYTSSVSVSDLGKLTTLMRSNYDIDKDEEPEGTVFDELISLLQSITTETYDNTTEDNSIPDEDSTFEDYARSEWIKQHMEYAASDEYKQDIVREFTGCLNDVFVDIKNDDAIRSYATLDSINQILEFDIDLSEAQEYELLLGQIFFSYIGEDAIEEIYAENMSKTVIMLGELMLKSDDFKQMGDSEQLEGILEALKSSEGVDELKAACGSFFNFVDGYDNINIKEHIATNIEDDALGLAWDITIDGLDLVTTTLKELTMYVAAGEAYSQTSNAFGKLLLMMRQNIDVDSNNPLFQPIPSKNLVTSEVIWNLTASNDSLFPDPLNTPVVLKDLATAIENFYLSIETYKNEDSTYIAQNAIADLKDGAVNDVLINNFENATVSLFSCLPVVREYNIIKDILGTGQSLIKLMTSIEDQEYLGTMFIRLNCISYLHWLSVDSLAGTPESWESVPLRYDATPDSVLTTNQDQNLYEYQFERATDFDEAVNVYKSISVVAADYALKYTNIFLGEAIAELYTYDNGGVLEQFLKNRDKLVQAVNDYKNTVTMLENQRAEIQTISCHNSDLIYDSANDEIIDNFKASRIYIVACPVNVVVKNDTGEQIAHLSGEDDEVLAGYEFYFHTIKIPDDSGEYIKVAIVPDNYQIELNGTDTGVMNAFVVDLDSKDAGEVETYLGIPIQRDSVGYFEVNSEKTNKSGLVMDHVAYSNMQSVEDIPTDSGIKGICLWIVGGIIVCMIVIFYIFKKKSHK